MRPIDGDALQDRVRKHLDLYGRYTRDQIEELIDSEPTIMEEDIAQHARWIYLRQCKCYDGDYIVPAFKFECSACGAEVIATNMMDTPPTRCIECGSEMAT